MAELPVPGIYRLDAQLVKMLAQVPVTVLPVLPATLTLTLDKINFKALIYLIRIQGKVRIRIVDTKPKQALR